MAFFALGVPVGASAQPAAQLPTTIAAQTPSQSQRFASRRILVEAKAGVGAADFDAVLAAHGGRSQGKLRGLNVHVVTLSPGQSERDIAAKLAAHPHVKFAELDELVAPQGTTNDPLVGNEWHLTKIGAPTAWAASTGAGTIIAIIDSGVDGTHPDLAAQMVPGWNFYDNNSNTSDPYGHGTAVAGTAAAASNNAIGVASVAWGARLMPVRISDASGFAYWSTIAQGLTWAADNGARIANISYAVGSSSTIQSAAQYMRNKGGVVAVSAGNNGIAETTAASGTMIIVSATDSTDARTSWSSYGNFVDLAAPGQNIYTTVAGGSYGYWWGTSFSAPIVAGVAALVKTLRPDFTAAQIEDALFSSAVDLGGAGWDPSFGYGRVNAAEAIVAAKAATPDTTPPTVVIAAPTGGTVSGSVNVNVNASDNVSVMRVDLKVNGQVIASDTTTPYSFVWNSATLPDGAATLTAVAVDAAGTNGTSAPVTVNVANSTASTTPPTVAILSPRNGSKVGGSTATVSGSASDPAGLSMVKLTIDGVTVASGNTATLSYKWNLRKAAAGSHTISIWAQNTAGRTASTSISVTK